MRRRFDISVPESGWPSDLTEDNIDARIDDLGARDWYGDFYAIRVRNRVEADSELINLSVIQLWEKNIDGITLKERLIYELKYYDETNGDHLDKKGTFYHDCKENYEYGYYGCEIIETFPIKTLCPESQKKKTCSCPEGGIPYVYWYYLNGDSTNTKYGTFSTLIIDFVDADYANSNTSTREVVIE